MVASAAEAATLQTWQYDRTQNQLEFTTDAGVQPTAQLVPNPTRLVIDLPGIRLGRSRTQQLVGGAIRSIRVGQFDPQTARIVIEMAPGYTLDPNQIKFRGITSQRWTVQLPPAQPLADPVPAPPTNAPSTAQTPTPSEPSSINTRPWKTSPPEPATSIATIESIQLDSTGTQVLVKSSQTVTYTAGWDRATTAYRILVYSAQLAGNIQAPPIPRGSSILQLRYEQQDARTVAIYVYPAAGVQIRGVQQPSQQLLALSLRDTRSGATAGNTPLPVPTPTVPTTPPVTTNPPRPNNGRPLVVVDPGHGGPDPGAVGIGGIYEKEIVLDISLKLAAALERQGIQVIMTRQADIDLDLEPRVQIAQRANATIFVSIHANAISLSRPDVNGLETYYYESGKALAQAIHQQVLQDTGVPDRRVRQARFYVLRQTSMPSVLVETGFITGQTDVVRLSNPAFRTQMAEAIARGILQYLNRSVRY